MKPVVDQPQLPLRLVRAPQAVDPSAVIAQKTLLGAIKWCIATAGFEADKEVYGALDIDAGHWSRIMRGEAHFPVDKLDELMTLCGNEAPMLWLVNCRGYDVRCLRKLETVQETRIRELEESLAAERARSRILAETIQGKVSA